MTERLQNGAQTSKQVGNYNTYVGARYVPLIDGEWDADKNYEPLTIVINQGNSYTSAQYVPKGVPLQENGPYWFKTGNFNGQVSSLETRIDELSTLVTQQGNIINAQANELQRLTQLSNKYYLFVGDSWQDTCHPEKPGWATNLVEYMGLSSDSYTIVAESNAGFYNVGDSGHNYIDLVNNIPQSTLNKVTHVVVETAGNDNPSEPKNPRRVIEGAELFYSTFLSKLPNVREWHLLPCLFRLGRDINKRENYLNCTTSEHWLTPVDIYQWMSAAKMYETDGVHLTNNGYHIFAKGVQKYLSGYNSSLNLSPSNYNINTENIRGTLITGCQDNSIWIFTLGNITGNGTSLYDVLDLYNLNTTYIHSLTVSPFYGLINDEWAVLTQDAARTKLQIQTKNNLPSGQTFQFRISGYAPAWFI